MYFFYLCRGYLFVIFAVVVVGLVLNDYTMLFDSTITVTRFYVGTISLIFAIFGLKIGWFLFKNRDVYERNRRATRLLAKVRRGSLTKSEAESFSRYKKYGILTHNSHGELRLSDQAVRDLFT